MAAGSLKPKGLAFYTLCVSQASGDRAQKASPDEAGAIIFDEKTQFGMSIEKPERPIRIQ
jgi:hypothetical protein